MAQRREYSFNPLDLRKDVAIGVTLPFGKKNGAFSLSYTTEEQSISNLKNLLLTRKGERTFQPNFGSSLHSLLFEPIVDGLSIAVDESLREDIGFWLPYIVIDDIETEFDSDRNTIRIQLSFRVTEQGANTEITVFVDSAGITSVQ